MIGFGKVWSKLAIALAIALAPVLLVGCVKEAGDIDRTQSVRLDKGQLAGVWYYIRTVIDVPFSTAVSFQGEMYTGSNEGAQKIMFDVQENLLLAYPVFEKVDGAESKHRRIQIRKYWDRAARDQFIEVYVGQPVAAWTITSHYDVIRDYNTVTGEQGNVLVENTTDRPWWLRDFIRVDWNSEQVGDIGFVAGSVEARSLQFVEEQDQNPLSPDAPDYDEGYIGVVTKYYVKPNPAGCAIWGLFRNDCAGASIKVRHSFKMANPGEDAIVRRYTNREHMDKFGYFLADRYDFDPLFGYTETARDYKAQLWNLWNVSQSWEPLVDAQGNETPCLLQTDCPQGTRCRASEWFVDGRCEIGTPLPYRSRGFRTIVNHISASHPGIGPTTPILDEEGHVVRYEGGSVVMNPETKLPHPFVIEAYEAADGWNATFKETVAWLFYHEDAGALAVADKREGAKACSTHSDCLERNKNVLLTQFADTKANAELACSVDNDCQAGYKCTAVGNGCNSSQSVCNLCAKPIACSANEPCPWGATCSQGQCKDSGGVNLNDVAKLNETRAYTFVVFADGAGTLQAARLTDRVLPLGDTQQSVAAANQALIRFVNADTGRQVSLRAINSDPADAGLDTAFQADTIFENVGAYPSQEAEQERMLGYRMLTYSDQNFPYAKRSIRKLRRVEVVDGGQVLATLYNVNLEAGRSYLFVYSDSQLMLADNTGNANGVRVINAVPTSVAASLDFGIDSLVLGREVSFGTVIPHTRALVTGTNRFVVLSAGAPGDVVCYDDRGFGKCIGWGAILRDEAKARFEEIYNTEVPDLYVLCEPIYHGDDCSPDELGNKAVYNDCRYSSVNPDGSIANPCKDGVARPYGLKKLGDIRYNPYYWIEKAQAASPLGYGPSAADPDFGNLYYGISNLYGAPMYTQGKYAVDLLDLMNGNLNYDEVATGDYIRKYIQGRSEEFPDPSNLESHFEGLMLGTTLSGATHGHEHNHGFAPIELPPALRALTDQLPLEKVTNYSQFVDLMNTPGLKPKVLPSFHPSSTSERSARLAMVRGSWVEDLLMTDEVRTAATGGSLAPGLAIPPEMHETVSTAALDPDMYYRLESQRNYILGTSHCMYMAEFNDDALLGLVEELGCTKEKLDAGYNNISSFIAATKELERIKALRGKALFRPEDGICLTGEALEIIVTARTYGGVLEHEIGHTVSLRHNFAGSGDVFNFFDEWYDIREKERVMCFDNSGCDEARNQVCVRKCTTNADCPSVAECQLLSGQQVCVDMSDNRADVVGWCMGAANQGIAEAQCTYNPAITAPSTLVNVWVDGACQKQTYCTKNVHCSLGQRCDGTYCVDQFTGEVVRAPALVETCGSDAVCGAGNRCDNGLVGPGGTAQCLSYVFAVVPRARLTEAEARNKRVEYQDSSVMDYGQKINSHLHGLGKYDHAAIKFGYGDLVEVYMDTSHIDEFVKGSAARGMSQSTISFYRTPSSWNGSLNHPYRFLNHVLGVQNAGSWNRVTVPYQQVKLEREMQFDYLNRQLNTTYLEVPYEFCSDEFRGNGGCYIFDAGVDAIEVVEHSMDMLREYYLFDAFKRDRYGFGWGTAGLSYYARIRDRWMQPMRNSGLYAALYTHLFGGLGFWERFSKEPMSGAHFGVSSRNAFQYLFELVASPAPGAYSYDEASDSYVNTSYQPTNTEGPGTFNIEVGIGKYPNTTFDSRFGYMKFSHPIFVGSYWEKLAAISVLTENDVTFLSDYVGESLDIGIKSAIGFTSLYPTPIINLFGAIVADAPEYWAGVVEMDQEGKPFYRPRNALLPMRDSGLPTVQPSLNNLSFKALAGVYALSQVPAAFDPSITDSLGVVFRGHKSDYLLSEGLEWSEFEDPFGKKVYMALQPRYDANRIAASALLIGRANELKTKWLSATSAADAAALAHELNQVIDVLDMLRELTAIYGVLEI